MPNENPIYVDGTTVTGDGTTAHPLTAIATTGIPSEIASQADPTQAFIQCTGLNIESGVAGLFRILGTDGPTFEVLLTGGGEIDLNADDEIEIISPSILLADGSNDSISLNGQIGGGVIVGGVTNRLLGFYGNSGTAQPTITGAKGGNAALTNLLIALANMGLIVNNTT
jgi:hypothetical protein